MTRREHLEQLYREHGATPIYEATRYGMQMNVLFGEAYLAPWGSMPDEELYWVGLHELGHYATESSHLFSDNEADVEAVAWLWAVEHSAFPFDQAAESAIAWGIADRIAAYGLRPTPALERIYKLIGPEPDWFFNTDLDNPEHARKFYGYALPAWRQMVETFGRDAEPSAAPALVTG